MTKLKIVEVKDIQEVGDKKIKMLSFMATNPQGETLLYSTFKTRFFDTIKVGAEIEAEFEVKQHGDYTNRTIVNIAGMEAKPFSRGGGKSPEEIASIETQVAVKSATELWVGGKLAEDSLEVLGLRAWIAARLSGKIKVEFAEVKSAKVAPQQKPPETAITEGRDTIETNTGSKGVVMPTNQEWTDFWVLVGADLGLDSAAANDLLEVKSIKTELVEKGITLKNVYDLLVKKTKK